MATQTTFSNEKEIDFNDQSSEDSPVNSPDDSQISEYLGSEDEQYPRRTCGVTKTIGKTQHPRKKYRCISDGLREKLIDAVETRGLKIKQAAKKLRINYSSAKSIYQVYKKEGRLSKKIMKKRVSKSSKDPQLKLEINIKDEEDQNSPYSAKVKREAGSDSSDMDDDHMVNTKAEESDRTLEPSAPYMVKTEDNSWIKTEFGQEKINHQYPQNMSSSNFNCPVENSISPANTLSTSNAPLESENLTQIDNSPPKVNLQPDLMPQNNPLSYPPYLNQNMPMIPNLPFMANNNNPGFNNPQALHAQNLYMQSLLMNQYNPQYAYINPMMYVNQQQQQQQQIFNKVVQNQNELQRQFKKTKR